MTTNGKPAAAPAWNTIVEMLNNNATMLLAISGQLKQINQRLDGIEEDRLALRNVTSQLIEQYERQKTDIHNLGAAIRETLQMLPIDGEAEP